MKRLSLILAFASFVGIGATMAQETKPPSAEASDPKTMGWMHGFPPPDEKTIRFTDSDYFAFPKLRWTACHFRQLMPNVAVQIGSAGSTSLPVALDIKIDDVTFTPLASDKRMTWDEAFDANYSDGVLVIHKGRIVYERYGGCLNETTLHGAMSVTKSITGLIGESLIANGKLDENAKVGSIVAELKDSAFGDATVRQVLEMTSALDYSKDYSDPKADVWTYA